MSKVIDWDKPLSDEDLAYVRMRGNVPDMRRAGLLPNPDFDLSGVPDSMLPHEIDGTGEPTFDVDSKIAEQSVGEPGANESTYLPTARPNTMPDAVPFKNETATPAKTAEAPKA